MTGLSSSSAAGVDGDEAHPASEINASNMINDNVLRILASVEFDLALIYMSDSFPKDLRTVECKV